MLSPTGYWAAYTLNAGKLAKMLADHPERIYDMERIPIASRMPVLLTEDGLRVPTRSGKLVHPVRLNGFLHITTEGE